LLSKINHLEQQLKLQDNVLVEVKQQRDAEKEAFKRNLESSRSILESKYTKSQSVLKDRDALLILWTEFATATLIDNPDSSLRPLLSK